MSEPITIPLSKTKLGSLLLMSFVFVLLGLVFVTGPATHIGPTYDSPVMIQVIGSVCILFFGLFCFFLLRKFRDKKPGLIIDSYGITDNSSAVSAGAVPWTDIIEIKTARVSNQQFLNLFVSDPEVYINRQTNSFKRKTMALNYKLCGTPVCISASGLQISFKELEKAVLKNFAEYRSSVQSK